MEREIEVRLGQLRPRSNERNERSAGGVEMGEKKWLQIDKVKLDVKVAHLCERP